MCLALDKWMLKKGEPFDKPPTRDGQGYYWSKYTQTWMNEEENKKYQEEERKKEEERKNKKQNKK